MWKGLMTGVAALAMSGAALGADYYLAYKMNGTVKGVQMPIGELGYSKFQQSMKGYLLLGMTVDAVGDNSALGDARILVLDSKTKTATEYKSNLRVFQKFMTDGKAVFVGGAYNIDAPVSDPIFGLPAVTGHDGSASYTLATPTNKISDVGAGIAANVATSMKGQSNVIEISTGVQNAVHSATPSYNLDIKRTVIVNESGVGCVPPTTIDAAMYALEAAVAKGYVTKT